MNIANRKDVQDFEQKPLPDLPDSTYEAVARSATKYPNRVALKFFLQGTKFKHSAEWTYKEILKKINATANMFRDLGIRDTDVVSYILPNSPETVFTLFGAETAGIVNAVNPLLQPSQMAEIMNAAGTKVLVTLSPFPKTDIWEKVSGIFADVPTLQTVITVNLARYLDFIPKIAVQLTVKKPRTSHNIRLLDFHKTVSQYPEDHLSFQRTFSPDTIASYFHTGGTTGKPKIAQHTHRNEIANAWSLMNWADLTGYKTLLCGLPWFHVNGVIVTGIAPLLSGGCILLATPSGYRGEGVIKNFWKIVEHYKISFFSSVPTVLQMILETPREREDIRSLEYALCGAAPLPVKLFNDFEASTGVKIIEGYGFTEGACANSANPAFGKRKVGSIGLALPHHQMKIVVLEEKTGQYMRDAETDEIGIIVCKGINIFPGYKEAQHNENIWINDGNDVWYNTGDTGKQDADGYFWITGRKKELIIRGGHNIDPKAIEEPLSQHPAVAMAAAIGSPDKRVGEMPVAFVQLKPNQQVSEEELRTFAQENIAEKAAIPKEIFIVEVIPLTAVGKIFKPGLTQTEIKRVFSNELKSISEIENFEINVDQTPQWGMVAYITTTGKNPGIIAEKVKDALGNYTVKYQLK